MSANNQKRKLNYTWPVQVNRMVPHGGFDLVLSIGQVVPHEVIGMANYKKNMLIGTGGQEGINRSHYLGVVHGMERVMGRAKSPVRNVLNYAADHFLHDAPIVYILTVIGKHPDDRLVVRGLLTGDDIEYFHFASDLSLQSILKYSIAHLRKVVVYLGAEEFHSTWLGNRAIDRLIRKYGYHGTRATLGWVEQNPDTAADVRAAAHLIHGSSEEQFKITWCPGLMTPQEIKGSASSTKTSRRSQRSTIRPRYSMDSTL